MSVIFPPPGNDVALFNKNKPKKPKEPLPWWLNLALFPYASAIFLSFGYIGAQFGIIAFNHPADPYAMAGMLVGFVLGMVALLAGAVAGKSGLSLLGFS
ncbi:hypothetical protein [Dyella silvatica]|uniref:hypothetical protein n=1 Tax=Dyella silvatica TaxID=2992128 RepID=UPI002252F53D|nr:hypothetical protein [Dyella silvatica]